jgi:hypothetical protein
MLQCIVRALLLAWLWKPVRGKVFEWPTRFGDTVRAYQPNAASARWTLVHSATRN